MTPVVAIEIMPMPAIIARTTFFVSEQTPYLILQSIQIDKTIVLFCYRPRVLCPRNFDKLNSGEAFPTCNRSRKIHQIGNYIHVIWLADLYLRKLEPLMSVFL